MKLSQSELIKCMSSKVPWENRLVIEPLFADSIKDVSGPASINLHLGNCFMLPHSIQTLSRYHLDDARSKDNALQEAFIPIGEEFSLLPGQIIIGISLEWCKLPSNMTAYMVGRSVWGRRGLLIISPLPTYPGFVGTLMLEISNIGEADLYLKPGMAIGQLFFDVIKSET